MSLTTPTAQEATFVTMQEPLGFDIGRCERVGSLQGHCLRLRFDNRSCLLPDDFTLDACPLYERSGGGLCRLPALGISSLWRCCLDRWAIVAIGQSGTSSASMLGVLNIFAETLTPKSHSRYLCVHFHVDSAHIFYPILVSMQLYLVRLVYISMQYARPISNLLIRETCIPESRADLTIYGCC